MPTRDVDSGLVGLLLTCKTGTLQTTGPRRGQRGDVAKEFVLYLDTTDENDSWLSQVNLNRCGDPAACTQLSQSKNPDFVKTNKMSHINGRVYGNLEGLEVSQGETVAFYLFSVNRGITSVQFSGQVLKVNNHIVDSIILFPATFVTAIITPPYVGNWLIATRNVDTFLAGQQAYLRVKEAFPWRGVSRRRRHADHYSPALSDPELTGLSAFYERHVHHPIRVPWTRKYYIAVEKYTWDYAPSGQDLFNGGPLTRPGSLAAPYFTQGTQRIGGRYIKARYVEYTDSTFKVLKSRDDSTEHLGMLGPVIMAEAGETVEIRLKNMADRTLLLLSSRRALLQGE
ncbi:hephaestin-like protein 1 [Pomacea canaliculata]|uniref:hephaestin-like protein 1 n=1 Tax=Pomacea canaliculata TaxID=400727 RepID=UPI000D73DFC5|nr:hephaestin-like protein 1 [Pomacea canaliculata]